MTDHDKLEAIERICREAFSQPQTPAIDLHRAQALANVYGVILYDGATITNTHEAVEKYREDNQLTIDEMLEPELMIEDSVVDKIRKMVEKGQIREPITPSMLTNLNRQISIATGTGIDLHFPMAIKMSIEDFHEIIGELHEEVRLDGYGGAPSLYGVPIMITEQHGIRLCIEVAINS